MVEETKPLFFIHDMVNPRTGKTYKQENLELMHNIPIGTLVEVKFDRWYGEGACMKVHARLWVVAHDRDCDGTPLYIISQWREPEFGRIHDAFHGFVEDRLIPVAPTQAILQGDDVLEWETDNENAG